MRKNIFIALLLSGFFILSSCKSRGKSAPVNDTPEKGTIHISVDETFRPVMEQQISMYEASYPEAHIIASYKSEADCFRDFFKDSATRLIIVGRGLTAQEERSMIRTINYNPGWNAVASDAVAIIVNKSSNDTLFDLLSLKDHLSGKINRDKQIVFDGLNATSTVRFIKDSVLKGGSFDTSIIKAVKNSKEVIDYVSSNPNSIGMVGISWLGNPEDSAQVRLLQSVKLAYVRCDLCQDSPYVKPNQQSMLSRRYSLVRPVCYIIKENFTGLGTGFVSFLKFERGQLIFRRSYLGPVMDFDVRNIRLNGSGIKK